MKKTRPVSPLTTALLAEIDEAAAKLGRKPRTLTKAAGQGGILYDRLKSGGRVWPETAEIVRGTLARLLKEKAERDAAAQASAEGVQAA